MSGILKIQIKESKRVLKELLKPQKEAKKREKLQMLYWLTVIRRLTVDAALTSLKTRQAETVDHLAVLFGSHRTTVSP